MESTQYEKTEEITLQFSLVEKAHLVEFIRQAACSLGSEEHYNQSLAVVAEKECPDEAATATLSIIVVAGVFMNLTKEGLSVMKWKKYAGHIVKKVPDPLESAGAFTMSAISAKGVMAAVVYSGVNKANVDCAWLLAFADAKDTGGRVYAECGPKDKFININWEQVKNDLEKAGAIAKAHDKETGTSLYAAIVGSGGKSIVGAVFLG